MLERRLIEVPGGRRWQAFTGGKGPELVWLHGVRPASADDPVLIALAQHFRVTAPLAPGFADTDELADLDDVQDLALAYDDLLIHLGGSPMRLAGHSYGGMIAAEVAARVPERVARLALIAPLGLWDDACPTPDLFGVPAADQDQLLWGDAPACEVFNARMAAAGPQDMEGQMVAAAQSASAVAKYIWPLPDKGLRKRLYRISARSLLLCGAEDCLVPPAHAREFATLLPRARVETFAGAGHMLPYEQCARAVGQLQQFLTD
jgi:pimeloyl-ACP methyl ester carboxylesterase